MKKKKKEKKERRINYLKICNCASRDAYFAIHYGKRDIDEYRNDIQTAFFFRNLTAFNERKVATAANPEYYIMLS